MNPFYDWLYDHYAKPRLSGCQFSRAYQEQEREWQAVAEKLPRQDRLLAYDLMDAVKDEWGTLICACGIQLGLALAEDPFEKKEPWATSPPGAG